MAVRLSDKRVLVSAVLIVVWIIFFVGGVWLNTTKARNVGNILFGSDQGRVSADLVVFGSEDHYRTEAHPLFVITFNPIGSSLRALVAPLIRSGVEIEWIEQRMRRRTGSEKGTDEIAAVLSVLLPALLMNSCAGALTVVLTGLLLRRAGVSPGRSALWAMFLGLSSTHLFWSLVPETHNFSAASLVVLYMLLLVPGAKLWHRIVATLVSFGINGSNLVHGAIVEAGSTWKAGGIGQKAARVAMTVGTVLALAIVFSLVQKLVYPSSQLFFNPGAVRAEADYIRPLDEPFGWGQRLAVNAGHILVYNLFAPSVRSGPDPVDPQQKLPQVTLVYQPVLGTLGLGIVGVGLWLALLIAAGWGFRKLDGVAAKLAGCLLAATAFNLLFFTVYGPRQSLFLYAPNCTFFVVAWAAISLEPMVTRGGPVSRALVIALCGLVVLEAITNIDFVYSVYSVYR